jgi:hypothetical protein
LHLVIWSAWKLSLYPYCFLNEAYHTDMLVITSGLHVPA